MEPSPLTTVYCPIGVDYSAYSCLLGGLWLWEPLTQQTYAIFKSRYVMTNGTAIVPFGHSFSVTEFGRCDVQ
jgi:hypothetical protein